MSAAATLVVRNIGELFTGDPVRGVVHDAAVAAHGATIVYAGPQPGLRDVAVGPDAVEVDARGMAVVPGFVDAHTHIVWLGDRGDEYARRAEGVSYEDIAAAGGGIMATVRATQAGSVAELVAAARARAARMLRLGTTTVEVKSGYGMKHDAEVRQLEAAAALTADADLPDVVATYLPLHAAPPQEQSREEFVAGVCDEGVRRAAPLARFVDAFCDAGAYTVEECERLFLAAREAGLRAKLHAEQRSHTGATLLAARVGAVSADHLEHATDEGMRALASSGTVGVILPGASLVLGGPPPPGRRLLDAGAGVAVATDCNPGTCYSESMPLMVSLAVALAGLAPHQALTAATHGGAAALALGDRGVLREGMRCDLCILESPHWIDVAYHLGANPVGTVIRAGLLVTP
ncbi:MAG TPA: imidazolonepropionase [Candidatus Dormibacteraeota bacterium]|jgi:imidazolonepropionase|nr:imidazolonepropionase [Candidatus Dormibacteraeota bacterium]